MEVVILPDSKQIAALAADTVEALLRRRPDAVLGSGPALRCGRFLTN